MEPSSMLDVEPFREVFDLYDLWMGRGAHPDAARLFERLTPGEEELLRLLDRFRQLPPIPVPPERG